MEVNGHKLPPLLVEMLLSGRWKLPNDTRKLKEITRVNSPQYFTFLSFESILGQIQNAKTLYETGDGSLYNFDSSQKTGKAISDLGILDIDKAIMIVLDWDENAIFLDYRNNDKEPKVMYQNLEGRWEEIASSFGEFIMKIGLS